MNVKAYRVASTCISITTGLSIFDSTFYRTKSDGRKHFLPLASHVHCEGTATANSTSSDDETSPCDDYNSISQRISWAERRNRCNAEKGCKFIGRRFTGSCIAETNELLKDATVELSIDDIKKGDDNSVVSVEVIKKDDGLLERVSLPDSSTVADDINSATDSSTVADDINSATAQIKSQNKDTDQSLEITKLKESFKKRVYAEIVSGNDNEITAPLRVFVIETLTSSASDSIIDSQQLANELAKSLIIEVLQDKSNHGNLGELLRYTFASPTVLCPTRDLVYWCLSSDQTFRNILWNTQWHRNYWLEENSFDGWYLDAHSGLVQEKQELDLEAKGGREFTQRALVTLASQWLGDPLNRTHTVTPLLDWTLKLQKEVIYPLGIATAEALPWTKDVAVEGIIYAISETLKSEESTKAAADMCVSYFKQRITTDAKEIIAKDKAK